MHSCWSIFYFMLIAFVLKLFAFKILFRKGFGKWIRKEKEKKKTKKGELTSAPSAWWPSKPAAILPPRPKLRPMPSRLAGRAPSPLFLWRPRPTPSLTASRTPHVSVFPLPFLLLQRVRHGLHTRAGLESAFSAIWCRDSQIKPL